MFTSEFCVCYGGFGPADSSPNNWCRSPENDRKQTKNKFGPINMLLVFFKLFFQSFSPSCRKLVCLSISLLVKCNTKCSCLSQHSKESFAVKVARLLWHYCAAQMQGFSIFLTAWQTHSNPQSLSLLILSDKGAHKAREGCSVPSIPGQNLSLQTQTCQLTSPGLMSLRALSWSRKLLSGKEASALGIQLWLPAGVKGATRQKKGGHQTAS